ncbi:Transcription factor WhiB [Haloechinothrix alba]|uniref:Transcription factor WhiB n=1 Tax=Haloechinothrix alba TaxID=664784 RepID=A0A238WDB3_9PSEU|nr:WhiB family transcriptional regulator [Haloechinothrix alba]SNR44550.1 Transcription factor WhiB [Haloechinothrix alba]
MERRPSWFLEGLVPELPEARCAEATEPLWDDTVHGESAERQRARHHAAQRICAQCPVQQRCYQVGAELQAPGVWGGVLFEDATAYGKREAAA